MLTSCPEIRGGNYIAVQRGGRGKITPSLHPQKPFANPSRESTVVSSRRFHFGSASAACSCLLFFQRKIGQDTLLTRLVCLPCSLPSLFSIRGVVALPSGAGSTFVFGRWRGSYCGQNMPGDLGVRLWSMAYPRLQHLAQDCTQRTG